MLMSSVYIQEVHLGVKVIAKVATRPGLGRNAQKFLGLAGVNDQSAYSIGEPTFFEVCTLAAGCERAVERGVPLGYHWASQLRFTLADLGSSPDRIKFSPQEHAVAGDSVLNLYDPIRQPLPGAPSAVCSEAQQNTFSHTPSPQSRACGSFLFKTIARLLFSTQAESFSVAPIINASHARPRHDRRSVLEFCSILRGR
ncbi:hypothetical protein KFL_001450220 [Klebsormidium nitens]|uniref:Uncharacterized protein n=1 Tax=Klebsormidium nitens TaxID=105231 RepID=A0A1Y1I1Q6_KLENI|nr:hypothetical protein KFL_001450220 [Klebsormidium nitens]|eukprot:GAQ83369.1 hypothetical protein KFL_001450220 [Klebsormidium nitens]